MPLGANKVALFGVAGVADSGTAVLLSTATASDDASIEFTLPTAYKQVNFGFYNVTPATDGADLTFQVNAAGQSGFNETMTTTVFRAYLREDGSGAELNYEDYLVDQAQGTAYQLIAYYIGSSADESCAGILHLFNPASTTFVKHFYSRSNTYSSTNYAFQHFTAGYVNTTAAVDEISFKMSSGNISSGTIKMWGIS
tara:strand:+ start:64 stop:654 length:591 start_codon:yes stop_codon:yes gene_type:complete